MRKTYNVNWNKNKINVQRSVENFLLSLVVFKAYIKKQEQLFLKKTLTEDWVFVVN